MTARSIGLRLANAAGALSAYAAEKSFSRQEKMELTFIRFAARSMLTHSVPADDTPGDLGELLFELGRSERLAAQPSAADGATTQGKVHARILETG